MASKFDELDLLFGTRLLLLSSTSLKLFPGDVPVYGTSAEITMKNILNMWFKTGKRKAVMSDVLQKPISVQL